ncbi:32369_t:CDS:2 [Gigaspora margarita]|uniref:32369_t:CDS:1 n=1 Tax=Gigaspora margarita TaxID=4874 RepID=A0ABN7V062_GIGMA|nr:32369_t:CDS:2 [Gigaspora margarita]
MKLNLFLVTFFFIVLIGSATAINDENRQLFKRQSNILGQLCIKKKIAPDGGCIYEFEQCFLNNGQSCGGDGDCLTFICSKASQPPVCQSKDNRKGGDPYFSSFACDTHVCQNKDANPVLCQSGLICGPNSKCNLNKS